MREEEDWEGGEWPLNLSSIIAFQHAIILIKEGSTDKGWCIGPEGRAFSFPSSV